MSPVIYANDTRYPGPAVHPAPSNVSGLPTQEELDAYPRIFTWGELKHIIQTGALEELGRNKEMQWKYDTWAKGIKAEYGSTENYLKKARLPFPNAIPSKDTYDLSTALDQPPQTSPTSGSPTSSSVGFVSLSSLSLDKLSAKVDPKSRPKSNGQSHTLDGAEPELEIEAVYMRYNESEPLDPTKYAVLPNDWPYCIPYGVRHYCVWSRLPIAHPELVEFSPSAWSLIESQGLGGFTGTSVPAAFPTQSDLPSLSGVQLDKGDWYSVDIARGGPELQRWTGVTYESQGGQEVGKMVRGLWDERGWECLWFVNPPRLQSVPGLSHFHVFARRKTPEEIDAAEKT